MLERYRLLVPFLTLRARFSLAERSFPPRLIPRFVRSFLLASEDFASKRRPFTIRHGRRAA